MTFKIQMIVAAMFLAAGCPEAVIDSATDKDTVPVVDETDTDTDADADSDTDADADTDTAG